MGGHREAFSAAQLARFEQLLLAPARAHGVPLRDGRLDVGLAAEDGATAHCRKAPTLECPCI